MIATIVAWTIFLANPAGQPAPFFFPNESETREYASEDLCMAGIREAKADQAAAAKLVCQQGSREVKTNPVHSVERRVEADAPLMTAVAKQTETEYLIRYQIGRFDGLQVFHRTTYDTTSYSTQGDCEIALKKAKVKVIARVRQQGGDDLEAGEALADFKAKYSCQELHLDPNALVAQPPAATTPTLPEPPAQYQTSRIEGVPTTPTLIVPGMARAQTYRMAEYGQGNGAPPWIFYSAVYVSPAQCWGAVRDFISGEQDRARATFQSLAQNYAAALWYQTQLHAIEQHRRRLQCVTG